MSQFFEGVFELLELFWHLISDLVISSLRENPSVEGSQDVAQSKEGTEYYLINIAFYFPPPLMLGRSVRTSVLLYKVPLALK